MIRTCQRLSRQPCRAILLAIRCHMKSPPLEDRGQGNRGLVVSSTRRKRMCNLTPESDRLEHRENTLQDRPKLCCNEAPHGTCVAGDGYGPLVASIRLGARLVSALVLRGLVKPRLRLRCRVALLVCSVTRRRRRWLLGIVCHLHRSCNARPGQGEAGDVQSRALVGNAALLALNRLILPAFRA